MTREMTLRKAAKHIGANPDTLSTWSRENPLLVVRYAEKRGQSMVVDLEQVLAYAREKGFKPRSRRNGRRNVDHLHPPQPHSPTKAPTATPLTHKGTHRKSLQCRPFRYCPACGQLLQHV